MLFSNDTHRSCQAAELLKAIRAVRLRLSLKLTKRRAIHANYVYSCIDIVYHISSHSDMQTQNKCERVIGRASTMVYTSIS